MFRAFRIRSVFLTAVAGCLLLGGPADAGPISRLLREAAETAGDAGKRVDAPSSLLDDGISLAKKLPQTADGASVALLPAENGTWLLVAADGTRLPLSSLDQLPGKLDEVPQIRPRPLAGDAVPANPKRAKSVGIAVRESDYFKVKQDLAGLPDHALPVLVRPGGKTYPLRAVQNGSARILAVELAPDVLINPATARALDGNLKFLTRPVNRANLKIASFDSAAAKATPSKPADMTVNLNADILESSLAKFKNRTLAVSGQIVRNPDTLRVQLLVRDGKAIREIDLNAFQGAAERQRVNLMIVESASPVQPGKSWFYKPALEKRFPDASTAMTQADLIRALSPPGSNTLINAADERNFRLITTTSHARKSTPQAISGNDFSVTGWLLDASIRSGVRTISSNYEDPDHTDEVEGRWVPGISNVNLILAVILILAGSFLSWYLWKWWDGLWGYVLRKAGVEKPGSALIRAAKFIGFLPFAALMALPAILWIVVADWLKFLTWPIRKAFGR